MHFSNLSISLNFNTIPYHLGLTTESHINKLYSITSNTLTLFPHSSGLLHCPTAYTSKLKNQQLIKIICDLVKSKKSWETTFSLCHSILAIQGPRNRVWISSSISIMHGTGGEKAQTSAECSLQIWPWNTLREDLKRFIASVSAGSRSQWFPEFTWDWFKLAVLKMTF